jgi:hypothetical protein
MLLYNIFYTSGSQSLINVSHKTEKTQFYDFKYYNDYKTGFGDPKVSVLDPKMDRNPTVEKHQFRLIIMKQTRFKKYSGRVIKVD